MFRSSGPVSPVHGDAAMARNNRKIKKANHGKRPCCGNLVRKKRNKFRN